MINNDILNTEVLPKYTCNNCAFYQKHRQIVDTVVGTYAVECSNLTHPLADCIMRGFEGHSEQPGFSQTLNSKWDDR